MAPYALWLRPFTHIKRTCLRTATKRYNNGHNMVLQKNNWQQRKLTFYAHAWHIKAENNVRQVVRITLMMLVIMVYVQNKISVRIRKSVHDKALYKCTFTFILPMRRLDFMYVMLSFEIRLRSKIEAEFCIFTPPPYKNQITVGWNIWVEISRSAYTTRPLIYLWCGAAAQSGRFHTFSLPVFLETILYRIISELEEAT